MTSIHEPPDTRLRVDVVETGSTIRVVLRGEADIANLELLATLLAGVEPDGHTRVELDIAELEFVDVAALRQLTAHAVALRQSGHGVSTRGAARSWA